LTPGGGTPFGDVTASAWYASYVGAAYKAGLVAGTSATTFDPDGVVTRQQAAVMLMRVMAYVNVTGSAPSNPPTFKDISSVGKWARPSVTEAAQYGLLQGYPDGTFRPDVTLTRAQGAVMLANLLKYVQGAR
ncbi:MAG: S-layer homology domain-containing protein, partial [Thermaerobacter sp.]|nr:S-layer homology domain-containing protein [Thermaerobacter sp.]